MAYSERIQSLITQMIENHTKDISIVLENARQLRDYAKENEDYHLLGIADYNMAFAYYYQNDFDSMMHYAKKASLYLKQSQDWLTSGKVLYMIAHMNMRTGNISQIFDMLLNEMKLAEFDPHHNSLGVFTNEIAADQCMFKECYEEAYDYLRKSEKLIEECTDQNLKNSYELYIITKEAICAQQLESESEYIRLKEKIAKIQKSGAKSNYKCRIELIELTGYIHENMDVDVDEAIKKIACEFRQNDYVLNDPNCYVYFIRLLMKIKKYEVIEEMFAYFDDVQRRKPAPGFLPQICNLKIEYYKKTNQIDKKNEALEIYWKYSEDKEISANNAVISLFRTQSNLAQSEWKNEKLKKLAETDALTSLPNRMCLTRKIDDWFEMSYHHRSRFGLELLDIDNFKEINDQYGHSTGDDVLVLIGKCLKSIENENVFAARYGGDEFTVLFNDLSDEEIKEITSKLQKAVEEGIETSHLPHFTISQGICVHVPSAQDQIWDYTAVADDALYEQKDNGKNGVVLVHGKHELKQIS